MRPLPLLVLLAAVVSPLSAALAPAPKLTRGPYLQCATPAGIKIVWRTRAEGTPGIKFGLTPLLLDQSLPTSAISIKRPIDDLEDPTSEPALASGPEGTRQFESSITGLHPDTLYYYSVTLDDKPLSQPADGCSFRTLPVPGTDRPSLFWVVGDSGTGNKVQLAVHKAMRDWLKKENRTLDGYLHVGDMAYGSGLDSEFQGFFFESYTETLRNTVCWPAMGNHEGRHSSGQTGRGPYYDAYICPKEAEAGGVASGTEAYYSFDFGKTHFICLNSHDLPRDPVGAMAQWLKADLEKTTADWLIAFWHHPPYTKGSHDSDKEKQLIEMRSMIMPILESGGVDLVLTGHSHIYERSMLMDGAYATPTRSANVILNDGDGKPTGDGPYRKSAGLKPNEGTVQIVAGHGGTTLSRTMAPSPVMRTSLLEFGSVLLDVKGDTLNALMLNSEGKISDTFHMVKSGTVTVTRIAQPWDPPPFTGPRIVPIRGKNSGAGPNGKPPVLTKDARPLIAPGATWQYLAGSKPAFGWQDPGFTSPAWLTGPSGFGYSDNDDATQIPDMRNKFKYICIRQDFDLSGLENPNLFRLKVSYDDGFIAYLNGREVVRANVESGFLETARGITPHEAQKKFETFALKIPPGVLKAGKNALSIEGYNDDLDSSDFTLNPSLWLEPVEPKEPAPDKEKEKEKSND